LESPISNISVVVPVYNEQDNVLPLVAEIAEQLEQIMPYEIVMVDDYSRDQTLPRLLEARLKFPALKVVQHQTNAGQSAAVISGVKAARYAWIVTLDGDRQNHPADILKLIEIAEQSMKTHGKLVVCAGHRNQRHDNFVRKVSSVVANKTRAFFLKDNCPDSGCGIKLFPKRLFLTLPHFKNCHRFLPALFKRAGARIINVPVRHRQRVEGQSKYGIMNRLWAGIVDLLGVAWLCRRSVNVEVNDEFEQL